MKIDFNFQTPINICEYMVSLIPEGVVDVFEPTPGKGNLVEAIKCGGYNVEYPEGDFFLHVLKRFGAVLLNPPFSEKSAYIENMPPEIDAKGMKIGYHILTECMKYSDNVIALMPWFTLSDSDVRMRFLKDFGLKSVTPLPRKTFDYARIQTVVIVLQKGYKGHTEFVTDFFNVKS